MGFFDSIKNGFDITTASLKVVAKDPEFLLLPIISGGIMLAIIASFFYSVIALKMEIGEGMFWPILAAFYLVSFTLSYFIQAMVIEAARVRFSGGNPTLGSAFSVAMKKIDKIILLAIIASIVSIIVQIIREKAENQGGIGAIINRLVASVIGAAWSVISYFSLPIILYEDAGVLESFGKGSQLYVKTWGENATASVSLLLLYVPAIILFILAFLSGPLFLALFLLGLVALGAAMILSNIASAIISQALYQYAKTGSVPQLMPAGAVKGFYEKR